MKTAENATNFDRQVALFSGLHRIAARFAGVARVPPFVLRFTVFSAV
jgi:hypothetical protein